MADQPLKPQFFVIREHDRMIPLIALDELPDHLVLRDVPRILTSQDIQGMTCAGTCNARHQKYSVQTMIQSPLTPLGEQGLSQLMHNSTISDSSSSSSSPIIAPELSPAAQEATAATNPVPADHDVPTAPIDQTPAHHANPIASAAHAMPAQIPGLLAQCPFTMQYMLENIMTMTEAEVSLIPRGIKIFCSHWCRTGNCDFTQQGCIYKHEMPVTPWLLKFAGLKDISAWYRQEYGLGSFRAVPGSDASFANSSLKSRIASGLRPQMHQSSNNWRTAASGDSSDSGSDTRPRVAKSGANRPARGHGRGSPLNPSRPITPRDTSTTNKINREVVPTAAPKPTNAVKRFSPRRPSHASVFSDFEAEIYREDTARKSQEETDRASASSTSTEDSENKTESKTIPAKTTSLGAPGSVSGSTNRRRGGGRGGSKK